ncbi:MAG: hypothetical protein JJE50_01515, partial [Actinomycetales bacterium]|nr:hypothetical protein [Actinomycetales bacterium]
PDSSRWDAEITEILDDAARADRAPGWETPVTAVFVIFATLLLLGVLVALVQVWRATGDELWGVLLAVAVAGITGAYCRLIGDSK